MATTTKQDYYELLGVGRKATPEGDSSGLPEACPQISSGPESRRQIRGRKIQAGSGSLRRPFRHEKAADVRSVRLRCRAANGRSAGTSSRARTLILADSISAAAGGDRTSAIFSANSFAVAARSGSCRGRRTGLGPRIRNRNRFLGSRARHRKESDHLAPGDLRDCDGTGAVGSPQTCEACGGTGQVSQTSGRMRFNVACTRCGGTGRRSRHAAASAAAKAACAGRRRSTSAFPRACRADRACAFPATAMPALTAHLPAIFTSSPK